MVGRGEKRERTGKENKTKSGGTMPKLVFLMLSEQLTVDNLFFT